MKAENNLNPCFDFKDSYDETVGFFSINFNQKDNFSVENLLNEKEKELQGEDVFVEDSTVIEQSTIEQPVVEQPALEHHSESTVLVNKINEQSTYEGTVNVFVSPEENSLGRVETTKSIDVNIRPVIASNEDFNSQPINNLDDNQVNADERQQEFFFTERQRLKDFYSNQKKKNQKIGIACLFFCFLIIPVFLAVHFFLKAAKYSKMGELNLNLNYSTLKWNAIKKATAYDIYVSTDEVDKFNLHSTQQEEKFSLPKGSNKYIVVAKNKDALIAVSEIISVSI